MTCDPNWSLVQLLLTFDGTSGSTSFPDSSQNNAAITSFGATVDTSTVMFGTGSVSTVGAGNRQVDSPTLAALPALNIDTGDFTFEFWANPSTGLVNTAIAGVGTVGLNAGIGLTSDASGNLQFTNFHGTTILTGPLTTNAWTHIAIVRQGSQFTLYLDGVGATGAPWAGDLGLSTSLSTAQVLLGVAPNIIGSSFNGFLDEFRLTVGLAQYTGNFTPPTAPFPIGACGAVVPPIVGLTVAQGEAALIAASLTAGVETGAYSGSIMAGLIISQAVAAGTPEVIGFPVDFTYSLGLPPAIVPNVVNTSAAVVAPAILAAAGFVVGSVTYASSGVIIAGNVISQSPTAGSSAAVGSGIDLVVSSGLPALRVPDIFGLSRADAILAITSLGLVVGAIGSAPSQFVPPGEVQAQNPSAGLVVSVGSIVSFVLSTGTPAVGTLFDFEATVISQYANSPVIMQLVQNLNQYIDQSANFANFFNYVWNVDTAVGFGLDIWGKIVGVSRLLQIPNTTDYVGFDNGTRSPPDWQSMGSDQPPYNDPPVGGAMYTGFNATSTYLLGDDAYRQLILAKAFANIATTTAPAINQLLQNLYGAGTAFVLNDGPMAISYNLTFTPSAIQLAILQQSGVIPTPPGVSVTINTNV